MLGSAIFEVLSARFGEAVYGFTPAVEAHVSPGANEAPKDTAKEALKDAAKDGPRDAFLRVLSARLLEVLQALRDEPDLRFDFLQNLTAVDWPETGKAGGAAPRIELVYHLYSYPHRHEIVVKVDLPRISPRAPSAVRLWPVANWLEREQFDLLGVIFDGHPDLRRLLLPDDWVGHPMRKDYREAAGYRGMPTTRPSPIDLLLAYDQAHRPPKPGAEP